jgi:5'(3')-deoxyribonucleotidase
MPTQEQRLEELKRLFVFVRCPCGLVYKVMARSATNDNVTVKCPGCNAPLHQAQPTDVRFGCPTGTPRILEEPEESARPTILLDMDGVCVQFMSAAIYAQGLNPPVVLEGWPKARWDIADVCNIEPSVFWGRIEAASPDFWINLKPYLYFDDMYAQLKAWGNVVFVTSPGWSAKAAQGKIAWLQKRFGVDFRNYIITNQKHLLAQPRSILIDDFDKNCEEFVKAGGYAVLFARPWNTGPDFTSQASYERAMEHTRNLVKRLGGA